MRTVAILLLAVGIALIGGQSGLATETGLTWKVDQSPFRITVYSDGEVLLREHAGAPGPGARLSYRTREGGGMHSLTKLISDSPTSAGRTYTVSTTEPDRVATVAVTRNARGLRVALDLGKAQTTVRTVYEAFDSTPSEHFLGTGERRDNVDIRGQIIPIKVWHPCGSSKPAPIYLSSRGYGINFRTTMVGRMAFGTVLETPFICQQGTAPCEISSGSEVVQACFKTDTLSYEIYAGTPLEITRAQLSANGRPSLPPQSQFEVIKWRDKVAGEADVMEDIDRFSKAGIPLGWVLIDNPWEDNACKGSLKFDKTQFPDPRAMIKRVHDRGIRVMLWVSPLVTTGCGQSFYRKGARVGDGFDQTLDLSAADIRDVFSGRLEELASLGVDGFKADRGDETDLELKSLAGASGSTFQNLYPAVYAKIVVDALRAGSGPGFATLFRSGGAGSQSRVPGFWSGDLPTDFNGIENAIRSGQTASLAGFASWGSDIGGYLEFNAPTTEVFVRWAQVGAISPIFEVGGPGRLTGPWELGEAALEGLRESAELHYALFPTHWDLANRAHRFGDPPLRPVAFEFPNDPGAWGADREIMLGPDLLAAPATAPGTRVSVYLPKGTWLDIATGGTVQGGRRFVRKTPLNELPLYLRAGSAIAFNYRAEQIWSKRWATDELTRPGRTGWLLGLGQDAEETTLARSSIVSHRDGRIVTVKVAGAGRESAIVIPTRRLPRSVSANGTMIPRAARPSALQKSAQGWAATTLPHRGLVLKLTPAKGRATVVLSF